LPDKRGETLGTDFLAIACIAMLFLNSHHEVIKRLRATYCHGSFKNNNKWAQTEPNREENIKKGLIYEN
jgi:hypothetical protein